MTKTEIMLVATIVVMAIAIVLPQPIQRPKAMDCVVYITDNRGVHHELHGAMEERI